MSAPVDHYEVLGVLPNASLDEIRKIFRDKALKFHPDRNPGGAQVFKQINASYAVLSDPEKRRVFNEERQARGLTAQLDEVSRQHHLARQTGDMATARATAAKYQDLASHVAASEQNKNAARVYRDHHQQRQTESQRQEVLALEKLLAHVRSTHETLISNRKQMAAIDEELTAALKTDLSRENLDSVDEQLAQRTSSHLNLLRKVNETSTSVPGSPRTGLSQSVSWTQSSSSSQAAKPAVRSSRLSTHAGHL